jgi:hypothetical protein
MEIIFRPFELFLKRYLGLRTQVSSATGFSPFFLIY